MPNLLLHSDTYGDARSSDLARDLRCSATPDLAAKALAADCYVVVATFDGDDPWDVYRHTQNGVVADSWSRTPPAGLHATGSGTLPTPRGEFGYRSSMIGDAVVIDGTMLVLTHAEFERVDVALPDRLRTVDGGEVEVSPAPGP